MLDRPIHLKIDIYGGHCCEVIFGAPTLPHIALHSYMEPTRLDKTSQYWCLNIIS